MTFVDTGAWFAFFIQSDPDHAAAWDWMASNRTPLLTTDYVIDETLTLMRAKRQFSKAVEFGTDVFGGKLAVVHLISPGEIDAAWKVFRTFGDKDWSFTEQSRDGSVGDLRSICIRPALPPVRIGCRRSVRRGPGRTILRIRLFMKPWPRPTPPAGR